MNEYFRKTSSKPEVWVFENICFNKPSAIKYLIDNGFNKPDAIEYLKLVKQDTLKGIADSIKMFSEIFNR